MFGVISCVSFYTLGTDSTVLFRLDAAMSGPSFSSGAAPGLLSNLPSSSSIESLSMR